MNATDSILLDRWATGRDAQAFAELVSRHAGMVYATCRRILRNTADAEEATQDCFLKLSQERPPKGRPLGTWLHRVATNGSLDLLRKNRRRVDREKTYVDAQQSIVQADWDDIQHYVDQAIEALPADLRAPIVHHFLEGKTQEETATLAGISRSGATRRIQRGVERIRKHLARRGVQVSLPALGTMLGASLAEAAPVPAELTAILGKLALAGATQGVVTTGVVSMLSGWVSGKGVSVGAGLLVAVLAITYMATRWPNTPEVPEAVVSSQLPEAQETLEPTATEHAPVEQDGQGATQAADAENTTLPNIEEVEVDDLIHGRVVHAVTGDPVALSSVVASGEVAIRGNTGTQPDDEGRFRFDSDDLGYGAFTLTVGDGNYYDTPTYQGVRRRGVPTPEIVLRVEERPTISGNVFYADGSPASMAIIMVRILGVNSNLYTRTDEDGRYSTTLSGNSGRLVLWASQNLLRSEDVVFELERKTSILQDFVLPPKGGFTLVVDTWDGKELSATFDSPRLPSIQRSILMTEALTRRILGRDA